MEPCDDEADHDVSKSAGEAHDKVGDGEGPVGEVVRCCDGQMTGWQVIMG